jgi:hypothetical protein
MTRIILSVVLASLLASCTEATVRPSLPPLDLTLTRACDTPVAVPDRDLSGRDVASLWGRDRLALRDCGRRHAATVAVYERRDAALGGE